MIVLAFAVLLSASLMPADLPVVREPFEISASPGVVAGWDTFDGLPRPPAGTMRLQIADAIPPGPGRVDVLERRGRRWVWLSTCQYEQGMSIPPAGVDRGILVRFKESPYYFWCEVSARSAKAITLEQLKNLTIRGTAPGAALSLYVASEQSPRSLTSSDTFRFVPLENALSCASSAGESACTEVAPTTTAASLAIAPGEEVRVLRVEPQAEDVIAAIARGNVVLRPKRADVTILRALPWLGIVLRKGSLSWADVLIDRSGRDYALERLEGSSLAPPPVFTKVDARRERGLVFRPYVGRRKQPLSDPDAELSVFPAAGGALSTAVPLSTVSLGSDGNFHLPMVGSGAYSLRLFSSAASSKPVTVSATAGVPADLEFVAGPTITGHVIRAAWGLPSDPITIEVAADTPMTGNVRPRGADLLDRMRIAKADDNGDFHVVLDLPGRYRLRVRWGASTAERTFEIESSDVDLGDIQLQRRSTLHGDIAGCRGGEANAVAVPDPSKPPSFDVLRGPIDADGRFFIEGLLPGQWSVLIRCGGAAIITAPQVVVVPDQGELVIHFTRTDGGPHSPSRPMD